MTQPTRKTAHAYHWNRDIICAVDTETTGLDPEFSEVIQVAIIPLTPQYRPNTDIQPLNLYIKPYYPDRVDLKQVPWGRKLFTKVMDHGIDAISAIDAIEDWYDRHLNPPYNKYGNVRGKIIPLGHNYTFDKGHIVHLLGRETYEEMFSPLHRDSMLRALHLNDSECYKGNTVPFAKVNLNWICKELGVTLENAHDALCDSLATAEVYRRMLTMGGGIL
jgi:DNA polymerase III epsilon subunit-like protein